MIDITDSDGRTRLALACVLKHWEIAKLLVRHWCECFI